MLLSYFAREDDAAHMYDRAAICVRGSAAILNYPRHTYDNDDLHGWLTSKDQLLSILDKFKDHKAHR